MNEAQEWVAYVARVNAVEAAKAAAKKSSEKPISALDTEGGDMIQYGSKA